jgi:hypothetical protein
MPVENFVSAEWTYWGPARKASPADIVEAVRTLDGVDERTAFWLVDSYVVNNLKHGRYLVVPLSDTVPGEPE